MQSLQTHCAVRHSISPTTALTAASFPALEAPAGTVAQADSKHISCAQSPHPRPCLCPTPSLPRVPQDAPSFVPGAFWGAAHPSSMAALAQPEELRRKAERSVWWPWWPWQDSAQHKGMLPSHPPTRMAEAEQQRAPLLGQGWLSRAGTAGKLQFSTAGLAKSCQSRPCLLTFQHHGCLHLLLAALQTPSPQPGAAPKLCPRRCCRPSTPPAGAATHTAPPLCPCFQRSHIPISLALDSQIC